MKNKNNRKKQILRFFLVYQKKYLKLAILIGLLILLGVLMQLPMPLFTRYFIDNIIPSQNLTKLHLVCLFLFLIIGLGQLINYFKQVVVVKYKAKVNYDITFHLYQHLQDLPIGFYQANKPGYIISRIAEISSAEVLMADTFMEVFKNIITIIVGASLILKMHWELGLVSLLILPFFIYAIKKFHKKIHEVSIKHHESKAIFTSKLESNISCMEKIKAEVKEKEEGERLSIKLLNYLNMGVKTSTIYALANVIGGFIGIVAPFIVLWYGGYEIMKGDLTLGTFFAINAFLGYLFEPANSLTSIGYKYTQAMAGLERVYSLFEEEKEQKEGEPLLKIDNISINNVSFSQSNRENILKNISLHITSRDKIAIVGRSGVGKSTLIKLLLKLYLPSEGEIMVSGQAISKVNTLDLRKRFAYISQSIQLLEENIGEKINQMKKIYQELNLLNVMNRDFDVNQKKLSGGEAQKIELALALSKASEVDVLILDEATSNLDYIAEKEILDAILERFSDKIVICIAHRLTSITNFQKIVVIDDGNIKETGSHHELLNLHGIYFSLWNKQLSSQN